MAEVEFQEIVKNFGSQSVLKSINLKIEPGEFLVLVGPSGCGKSTLLRILAGLEEPSSGEVLIGGKSVTKVAPKDRGVAMVFQNYALYPHMTVRQNIGFSLKLKGLEKSQVDARVEAVGNILNLTPYLDKKPHQLSGGQKQRVAMGRAMVREPSVFLFDEPLSNLDAQLRVKMRAEIASLHRRLGTTSVYVTHDQVEAMTLATRIAVLNEGKLEQVGRPLDLYHQPQTKFVASFIGSPSMNFLPRESLLESPIPDTVAAVGFRPSIKQPSQSSRTVKLGKGKIALVEPLGASLYVHLDVGAHRIVLESDPNGNYPVDSEKEVVVPYEDLFYFDRLGARVLHDGRV